MTKPTLLALSTFSIYPAIFGGQVRLWNLYSRLTRRFRVNVLAYDAHVTSRQERRIHADLTVTSLPISGDDRTKLLGAMEHTGLFTHDVHCISRYGLSPEFRKEMLTRGRAADYLVSCHPYFGEHILSDIRNRSAIHVYDAVDCEIIAKENYLRGAHRLCGELKRETAAVEMAFYKAAHLVTACSTDDMAKLQKLYGSPNGAAAIVPNGTDIRRVSYRSPADRRKLRQQIGLPEQPTLCFVGSGYYANGESLKRVLPALDGVTQPVTVILIGDSGKDAPEPTNPNVTLLRAGRVTDAVKDVLLGCSDVALHLIFSGSGTTLKLFDYMASGLPVIGTKLGFRGVPEADAHFTAVQNEHELVQTLFDMLRDQASCEARGRALRQVVEQHYSWDVIASRYTDALLQGESVAFA